MRHVHFETVRGSALDLNLVSALMVILPLDLSILNSVRRYIGAWDRVVVKALRY